MKVILWTLLAEIAVVIIGGAVFIATFNVDQYRPLLVQKISQAIDKKVTLEKLSLTWSGGIAVDAKKFAIYPGEAVSEKPLARFDQAAITVRLIPLLSKNIQVASLILVRPYIEVEREADGTMTIGGVKQEPKTEGEPAAAKSSPENFSFSVDSVRIQSGQIVYRDKTGERPFTINILDLDADIKDISFTKPLTFDVEMAIFGSKQNLSMKGKYSFPQKERPGLLEKAIVKADLSQIDWAEVVRTFPDAEKAGIRGKLAGLLELDVERFSVEPGGAKTAIADLSLKNGEISLKDFQSSFSRVNLEARMENNRLSLRDASAGFAGGDIKIMGAVDDPTQKALSDIKASFRDLAIEALMPPTAGSMSGLRGHVSLDVEGKAKGTQWPEISQTLSGQGRLTIKDGVILNKNVLRDAVEGIASVPVIGDSILSNFPANYQAKLNEPNTVLRPIDMPFVINNSRIMFENLDLGTDSFSLSGGGAVGFDKSIHAKTILRMDPQLSAGLINGVPQLKMLAGSQGALELPMNIDGILPGVTPVPDLQYIAQKLAVAKTQELVTGLLTKATKTGGTAGATAGQTATTAGQTAEQSVAGLLGKLLKEEK